jgi:hypothetical protein
MGMSYRRNTCVRPSVLHGEHAGADVFLLVEAMRASDGGSEHVGADVFLLVEAMQASDGGNIV